MERGPCFGTCPTYLVSVDGRGVVRFESRNRQDSGTVAVDTVGERGVAALRAAAERLRLDTLASSYRLGESSCGEGHTDAPTVTLAVRTAVREVRVVDYHGCPSVPPALREFEQLVDSVAGTSRRAQPNRIKGGANY
jgi:Domain of unknown function (DUF6438)